MRALHALALTFLVAAPAIPAQTPVDRFNETVGGQWNRLLKPELEKRLPGELSALAPRKLGVFELEKVDRIQLDLGQPPAIERLDRSRLAFRLPGRGGWGIRARAHLALRVKILGLPIVHRAPIDIDVSGFAASLAAEMSGGERPRIDDASTRVDFHLALSSPDALFDLAARLATWLFEEVLRGPVLAILAATVREKLLPLVRGEPDGWGEGGPPVEAGPAGSLAARAREIDARIQSDKMPYGTLLVARYSSPVPGQGTVVGYEDHGDSAIWTGHYLISQVFRHRATADPAARAGALRALAGIDDLFEVSGGRGILARATAPAASPDGQALLASGALHHRRTLGGVDTVGWGADFISRDQYVGAMAGMAFADLEFGASDPSVRAIVKKNVSAAVGRFLAGEWVVVFDDGRFSTTFLSRFEQQLAFLALARRVDPNRFDEPFRRHAPTAELVWFPVWTETWDPHGSYYKFNLDHTTLALVMSLDQDPVRWREYHRALRVLRGALDHHENAWFMTVEMLVDPASRPTLGPRTRNALDLWTKRHARAVSIDPHRIQALPTRPYVDKMSGGVELVAVHPVPIDLRYVSDFIWQRSPFGVRVTNDPTKEYPGLDLVLPYWIGRELGLYP